MKYQRDRQTGQTDRTDSTHCIPIFSIYPRNVTVHVPSPPLRVVTIISPFRAPGPVRQRIFVDDFHSAHDKQLQPQIVKPEHNVANNKLYKTLILASSHRLDHHY